MFEINLSILFASVAAGAAPIVLAAVGETITEKAGLINLSLDGSILLSAMTAFAVALKTGSLIMGFICAALVGALVAAAVAVFSIYLYQNQVAVGFVLTLMTRDLAYFIGNPFSRLQGPQVAPLPVPLLSDVPFLGDILFNHNIPVYVSLDIHPCLLVVHLPYTSGTQAAVGRRASPGIICQGNRPPEGSIAVCGLWRNTGGTGRGDVFTGHQARMGPAPGGGGNRLDCFGPGDFRWLASGQGCRGRLPVFALAGVGDLFPGMAAVDSIPGFSSGPFSADDIHAGYHVFCAKGVGIAMGGGESAHAIVARIFFRNGAVRPGKTLSAGLISTLHFFIPTNPCLNISGPNHTSAPLPFFP